MSLDVLLVFPPSRTHYSVPPLGLGFLADRNLGLMVVIVAALVVFAGSMYVSRIFHREMH